jgi:hypothetical protein
MSVLSEHYEQALVIQFMRRNYPEVLIFAIPNGGQRSAATGARLKAEGVVPGVPDLFIPAWGLFIEMKTLTGKVSPEQKSMLEYLQSVGYDAIVAKGANAAIAHITEMRHERK